MITVYAYKKEPNKDENYYEYLGLSTDTKSQDEKVAVNSLFFELDTGDFYYLETPAKNSKEVLIPQTSFVGNHRDIPPITPPVYNYDIDGIAFHNETIKVLFDGTEYECDRYNFLEEDENHFACSYGAYFDMGNMTIDFSEYPFLIMTGKQGEGTDGLSIIVQDDNQHTIEVYVDSSTPAVWKKVGSGASPSGDDAVVGTAIVGTSKVGKGEEPQEVVLIPETTFTTNEQGSYNFVGVEAFKYSQIKIVLNGEEKIVDGAKLGEIYAYILSGSVPNAIGVVSGTVMSKPIVSFVDGISQEPTTYTIKVIKVTDEEIPDEPQEEGYEINNPTLTFEVNNQSEHPVLLTYGDVNNDGYLTDVELRAPVGENIMNLVVLGLIGNGETSYEVVLESIPSSVNYTDNCSYSDGVITITDPSQDAVINIEYHGVG